MEPITSQEIQSTAILNLKDPSGFNDKHILIFLVDDNELYLKSLEIQFLENAGLTIKTFLSGEACFQDISLKPDIIVLDYFLNSINKNAMDGLKTLVLIKAVSPGTHVIMLSAFESAEVAVNCMKHGAFDYIVKNANTFLKLKESIKKNFSINSKEKELIVWDW